MECVEVLRKPDRGTIRVLGLARSLAPSVWRARLERFVSREPIPPRVVRTNCIRLQLPHCTHVVLERFGHESVHAFLLAGCRHHDGTMQAGLKSHEELAGERLVWVLAAL